MKVDRKQRLHLAAQGGVFLALLVALTMLGAYLAREYRAEWDVTHAASNTLSPGTRDVLKQVEGALSITVYAVAKDAAGVNVQKLAEERLRPYQREKKDITLALVDPREQPKRAAAAGIRTANEIVVEHRGRSERIAVEDFNEQAFANLLLRLARGAMSLLLWLDGHGERKLSGIANHDLGDFGRDLQRKGFRVSSVNLAVAQQVPDNTAVLVITTPQVDVLSAEAQKLKHYLERGGNLLWLIDPEPLRGLQPVAELLGLVLGPGTVVDFVVQPRVGPPVFAVGAAGNYARHPITEAMRLNTLFPYARQIGAVESDTWRITPLVDVAQRGWVKVGSLDGKITFDKTRDIPGPINIASAFERTVGDRQQRVVVVGNGNFLSNSFLGNGGNLDLGLAMMNWLAGADNLVSVQPQPAADARLDLAPVTLYLIAFSFLLALPAAFILTGTVIWWRRRRAG
jgi:hypothetical protein